MWEEINFSDTLVKNSVGRKNQISASEILSSGKYPVIDQGQDFIAGYCDDETKLVNKELPLIIFGDHTRCFKYVDFPFVIGADGTKALRPNTELFDAKYYYFALLSLDIPSRGYNRHFTLLKEKKVPKPERPAQRRIAYVLSIVQTAIEQQDRLIKLIRELKSALMHKLFTEGLRGEKQKMTEIGPVPESWDIVKIGDLFKFSSGKTRPTDIEESQNSDKPYPVYGGNGVMGYVDKYLLDKPTLILGRVGEYCGVAHHTKDKAWISDNALYTKEIKREVNTGYMTEYFNFANLNQYSNKAGQPLITQGIISAILIPLPMCNEQDEIYQYFDVLNKKIALLYSKTAILEKLFRTLLHQLMTSQTRVNDIDLPGFS
jgi:type I restriction enzyme, S subunit